MKTAGQKFQKTQKYANNAENFSVPYDALIVEQQEMHQNLQKVVLCVAMQLTEAEVPKKINIHLWH